LPKYDYCARGKPIPPSRDSHHRQLRHRPATIPLAKSATRNLPQAAVGWVDRPASARFASYGGFKSAEARGAKAEVNSIASAALLRQKDDGYRGACHRAGH